MRRGRPAGAALGRGDHRQPVGALGQQPLDAQRDEPAPGGAPGQPHAQLAERQRAVRIRREAEPLPRPGLVGDNELPGGGHARRSLPPFPTSWSR